MNKRLKTDLEVICEPSKVSIRCPYCKEEYHIEYNIFLKEMNYKWWCDWEGELITCEHCNEIFEIRTVHRE